MAASAGLWGWEADGPGGSNGDSSLLLLPEQVKVGGAAVAATVSLVKKTLCNPVRGGEGAG